MYLIQNFFFSKNNLIYAWECYCLIQKLKSVETNILLLLKSFCCHLLKNEKEDGVLFLLYIAWHLFCFKWFFKSLRIKNLERPQSGGFTGDNPPLSDFLEKRRGVFGRKFFVKVFLSKKISGASRRKKEGVGLSGRTGYLQ